MKKRKKGKLLLKQMLQKVDNTIQAELKKFLKRWQDAMKSWILHAYLSYIRHFAKDSKNYDNITTWTLSVSM